MTFLTSFETRLAVLLPALILLLFSLSDAQASWLLNPAEFHASAHGRTACTDCHYDVMDQPFHPNPANVDQDAKRVFSGDQCLECHDDILEQLDSGIHGSKKVKDKDKYNNCLKCHRWPHRQRPLGESRSGTYRLGKPVEWQCGNCHEKMSALPPFSEEDAACLKCHQTRDPDKPKDIRAIQALCFHCHGSGESQAQIATSKRIPSMGEAAYAETPHQGLACTACHKSATSFEHRHQEPVDCFQCHSSHIEKDTHGAHLGMNCQTCHLKGIVPFRDTATNRLGWKIKTDLKDLSILHQTTVGPGESSCRRCHFAGNDLGAASVVLPPKSILCMPCHTATFSLNDAVSITAFIIFIFGMVLFFSVLLTGAMNHISSKNPLLKAARAFWDILRTVFSPKIVPILNALFWDAFLQRRLYRRSPGRWFIHGLIFYSFVFRFCWGFAALLGSTWEPDNPLVWNMINRNHPMVAFLFDITGIMMLMGIVLAWVKGALQRRKSAVGTPPQDRIALALIGGIVIIGFVLEGMRIVMTGRPAGTGYSFMGYWVSLLFSPSRGLPDLYTFFWYLHAVFTGVFIAYIPFSRLLHMILAPVVISINAVSEDHGAPNEHSG